MQAEVHLSETELLDMYNRRARQLCIDKLAQGDISDIVQTLTNSDILMTVMGKNLKSLTPQQIAQKLSRNSMMVTKQFKVTLKCELSELEDALNKAGYLID